MRRRKYSANASSGSLLLDTLCNALGSVVFIALLVLLLAKNAPLLVPDTQVTPLEGVEEAVAYLEETQTTEELETALGQVRATIAAFAARGLTPQETDASKATLLAQRARIAQQYIGIKAQYQSASENKEVPPNRNIAIPPVRSSVFALDAKMIVFKDGKVSISDAFPIVTAGDTRQRKTLGDMTLVPTPGKLSFVINQQHHVPTDKEALSSLLGLESAGRCFVAVYPSGLSAYKKAERTIFSDSGAISLLPVPRDYELALQRGSSGRGSM
jgi:hypothetical protein